MPWIRAELHGQKVYARARPDGSLLAEGGRVEVCYTLSPAKLYKASASNVTIEDTELLPDEACSPPKSAPAEDAAAARARKSSAKMARAKAVPETQHPDGTVIVYADGACSGNPGPAGLGVVVLDGTTRTEISESIGEGTNNIAELTAIERALDAVADRERPLVIHTDSRYSIGVLSQGWKAKANMTLVARLRDKMKGRPHTRFVYVPGHAGVPLNERADELAREAVKTGKSRSQTVKV